MAEASGAASRGSWVPRLIAPLGLVLALIAIFVVIQGSLGIDDGVAEKDAGSKTASEAGAHDGDGDGAETPKTYTVEEGDTLSAIAEEFGVSTERLERLNPNIDPATLNAGTEIKIR